VAAAAAGPARTFTGRGLLTTTTRTQKGARLTFWVDAQTDTRTRLRWPACTLGQNVMFRPFNVGRVVVLTDPPDWNDLPEGILLSVFEMLFNEPNGRAVQVDPRLTLG